MYFRYLWILIIGIFCILAIYQIYTQVSLFLKTPISTNIEAHYPSAIPFPVIAICNNNQYRLTYLTGKRLLNRPRKPRQGQQNTTDIYSEVLEAAWDHDAIKFLRNAAHWKSRMILDCRWPNGTRCIDKFKAMWTLTGLCWAINTDPMDPAMVFGAGKFFKIMCFQFCIRALGVLNFVSFFWINILKRATAGILCFLKYAFLMLGRSIVGGSLMQEIRSYKEHMFFREWGGR